MKFSSAEDRKNQLIFSDHRARSELAALYEVHDTLLPKWRREFLEGLPRIFEDPRKKERDDKDALIRELYSQVGRLPMQLDWLGKKCGRTAPKASSAQSALTGTESHPYLRCRKPDL